MQYPRRKRIRSRVVNSASVFYLFTLHLQKANISGVGPMRLELVTSAMRRQGRGFTAVHWCTETRINKPLFRIPYPRKLPCISLHWCTNWCRCRSGKLGSLTTCPKMNRQGGVGAQLSLAWDPGTQVPEFLTPPGPSLTLTRMQCPATPSKAGNSKPLTYAGSTIPCNSQKLETAHS